MRIITDLAVGTDWPGRKSGFDDYSSHFPFNSEWNSNRHHKQSFLWGTSQLPVGPYKFAVPLPEASSLVVQHGQLLLDFLVFFLKRTFHSALTKTASPPQYFSLILVQSHHHVLLSHWRIWLLAVFCLLWIECIFMSRNYICIFTDSNPWLSEGSINVCE